MGNEKGLTISFENNRGGVTPSSWLSADLTRIRQVLLNLITNAIKFTPQGAVTVKLSCHDMSPDQCEIQISVADTGLGIDIEAQKKLFQSFSQVDASTTRRFGGTGLGLAISKGIVEALGGEIWVESAPNKGSIFSFKFNAKRTVRPSDSETNKIIKIDAKMAERKPLRILVADDQMPNRLLASNFLALLGYPADTVCNGLEALDAFNTNFYDVVFMDCQMPEMDGFVSTKKLKQRFLKDKSPWIIALTASAYPEDRERCRQSGMDDFITKPFNVDALAIALERASTRTHLIPEQQLQIPHQNGKNVLFDWNLMQRHFMGDQSIMFVVIEDFIRTYPLVIAQIQAAIETKNHQEIRAAAHKLRGNVANFYAKPIQNNLLALETMARNNELDAVPTLFSKIKLQLGQLKTALEKIDIRKVA